MAMVYLVEALIPMLYNLVRGVQIFVPIFWSLEVLHIMDR